MRIYQAINDHNKSVCRERYRIAISALNFCNIYTFAIGEVSIPSNLNFTISLFIALRYKNHTYDQVILPENRNKIIR